MKKKLELTWIGKDKRPKLEPRILLEDSSKMVLSRCEWAHDDYSLNVENLPIAQKDLRQTELFDGDVAGGRI